VAILAFSPQARLATEESFYNPPQPYHTNGHFADHIGRTWCFNPGFPPPNKFREARAPNHIWLNTTTKTATWHGTPILGHEPFQQALSLT